MNKEHLQLYKDYTSNEICLNSESYKEVRLSQSKYDELLKGCDGDNMWIKIREYFNNNKIKTNE